MRNLICSQWLTTPIQYNVASSFNWTIILLPTLTFILALKKGEEGEWMDNFSLVRLSRTLRL
uniref:Uncharacterized protein n=1 Tax=candidate division WOR-3 bacterium TaxID=2052148 RepID=A0A7C4XNR5_UNCW3